MAGTTKWFDPTKGFGFVSVEGGPRTCSCNVSVLERGGIPTLAPGQRVTMDVAEGRAQSRGGDDPARRVA